MPGAKIPVIEIEKLSLSEDGRGLVFYDDGTNFKSGGAWSTAIDSGSTFKCLGVASCNAWLRVSFMSGSNGSIGYGFVPVLSNKYGQE